MPDTHCARDFQGYVSPTAKSKRVRLADPMVAGARCAPGQWFRGTVVGGLVLFGCTGALIHPMPGGVRHLIWDTGRGLGPAEREWLARANLFGSISLTMVLWIAGVLLVGGAGGR